MSGPLSLINRDPYDAAMRYRPPFAYEQIDNFGAGIGQQFAPYGLRGDYGLFELWVRPGHAPNDGVNHPYMSMGPINANPASYVTLVKATTNTLVIVITDGAGTDFAFVGAVAAGWTQNVWHHLAGRWAPDHLDLYMNGVHIAGTPGVINVGDPALPAASLIYIGAAMGNSSNSDLAWARAWTLETPPDEYLAWLYENERGYFGV